MADGQILFEFATEGEGEVSAAVLDLKTKALQAAEAQTRLAAELRKVKDSGQLSAAGIATLERELAQAQIKASQFAQEARQAAAATTQMGTAAAGASRGMGQFHGGSAEVVNMLTEMSLGFGGLHPQIREFTTVLATGGNNVVQLSRVMGPLAGTITGLGASLIPLLITKIVEWTSEAGNAADANSDLGTSARNATRDIRSLIDAMNERERVGRLTSGQATAAELGQEIENKRAARSQAQADLDAAIAAERAADLRRQNLQGTVEEWRTAQREVERLRGNVRQLQAAEEALTARQADRLMQVELPSTAGDGEEEDENEDRRSRRRGRRHEDEVAARLRREEEFYQELGRMRDQDLLNDRRAAEQREQANLRVTRDMAEEERRMQREAEQTAARLARRHEREQREAQRNLEDKKREARAATEEIQQQAQGVLQPVIAGVTDAIKSIADGSKTADEAFQGLLASFLEMISQRAVIEAAANFAAAIADAASQNWGAFPLHLAAGVAWTGVAVAAGAASVAVAPAAAAAPASPQQQAPQQERSGGNLTVNVNGPIVTAGDRKANRFLGRELGRLVDMGAQL